MVINKNNKGSSMLVVIMTVALITVLSTMVLAMTSISYQMKLTDENTNKNFYNCEAALDEIKAGLQIETSECYVRNYLAVQLDDTLTDRQTVFSARFKTDLTERLNGDNVEEYYKYSVDNLNSYLSEDKVYDSDTGKGVLIAEPDEGTLIRTDNGIWLKDVDVTYYKDTNSKSRIVTDIFINYPGATFNNSDNPPLMEYAIVADKGVDVLKTGNVVSGSIYSGNDGDLTESINISGNANLKLIDSKDAVFNGDIYYSGLNAKLTTEGSTGLWARNIVMSGSSKLDLHGFINVVNDLIVEDDDIVTMEGSYYGFGSMNNYANSAYLIENGITGDDTMSGGLDNHSGAILVNGKNVDLDLYDLRYLSLGGSANIGISVGVDMTDQVIIGESIGVKGEQLAYLVPNKNIKTPDHTNPIDEDVYNSYVSSGTPVMSTEGISGLVSGEEYKAVYYPGPGDVRLVYLFLNFEDVDAAANYFEKYYDNNKSYVDKALDVYVNYVDLPREVIAQTNSEGNIIGFSEGVGSLKKDNLSSTVRTLLYEKEDTYAALKSTLKKDYSVLSSTEKSNTVYNNIVDVNECTKLFTGANSTKEAIVFETGDDLGSNGYEAMVINDNLIDKVVIKNTTTSNSDGYTVNNRTLTLCLQDHDNLRILISKPEVNIKTLSYNGLIISGDVVTLNKKSKIYSNQVQVTLALQAKTEDGSKKITDMLINGDGYLIGGSGDGTVYEDLISFSNWKKE